MGFLRSRGSKSGSEDVPVLTIFLASIIFLVIQGNPNPGFIGHPFPYYLHYPVVPFNNHLAPHFNSIQPPIVAHLAHPQQFFPQQWFQNPQFAQNQTKPSNPNPNPTRQNQPQPGQNGGGATANIMSQFQQNQIADIRTRLVQQSEKRNQSQMSQTQSSNNGNTGVGMQIAPLNQNVNKPPNNLNFGQGIQQNFGRDQQEGGLRQQMQPTTPPLTNNFPNQNFPWHNHQNFGWGWDNIGWDYVVPGPNPQNPPTSVNPPPAASISNPVDENLATPMMTDNSALTRESNSKAFSSKSSTTMLDNNNTMISARPTEIPMEKNENPLIDAVTKFRRIVSQIRDITRNELRS